MNSKSIMAIAVVAVVVIACVGIGVFFAVKSNDAPSVEKVKSEIEPGDFVVYDSKKIMDTSENTNMDGFLEDLYIGSAGTPMGEKDISVIINGESRKYHCIGYDIDGEYGFSEVKYVTESGFILETIQTEEESVVADMTVAETNLDVMLEYGKQKETAMEGSFYTIDAKYETLGTEAIFTFSISHYEKADDIVVSANIIMDMGRTTLTVKEVKDGTVFFREDAAPMSVTEFRGEVSYPDYMKCLKDRGCTVEILDETKENIPTIYGQRDVTVTTFTISDSDERYVWQHSYNSEGFIYESKGYIESPSSTVYSYTQYTLVDTNMVA